MGIQSVENWIPASAGMTINAKFSLGAVAFFLMTGRPPFDLENALELVVAHVTYPPPKLSDCGVTASRELEAVIAKCLAKKPEDRFQSPDELLDVLSQMVPPPR